MNDRSPLLSVVVPAYNEERRLGTSLPLICKELLTLERTSELLVVDDGSQDATAEVALGYTPPSGIELRLLSNGSNRGKGYSVRHGASQARGSLVLLTDADLSTPIEEWRKLHQAIIDGFDVAIGSRGLPQSQIEQHQPLYRETMGKSFNLLVRLLGLSNFRDTQCGFKLFRSEAAAQVLRKLELERFAFDVEALLRARRLGLKVAEVPVVWRDSPASRVRPGRDAARMAADLLRLKWRDLRGRYR